MFIINSPTVFSVLWKLISPMLKQSTKDKIQIIGSKYQEKLLAQIDAESLPEFLGGTCTCGGRVGGCIPLPDIDEGLTEHTVSGRGNFEQKIEVTADQLPFKVGWSFRVVNKDVKFRVEYVDSKTEQKTLLVDLGKVHATEGIRTEGEVSAPGAGTVLLTWDNTFSMFSSKTFKYWVWSAPEVSHTQEEEEDAEEEGQEDIEEEEEKQAADNQ
jgi:hypothetical protein